jgi:solute carrier family 35 protein F5
MTALESPMPLSLAEESTPDEPASSSDVHHVRRSASTVRSNMKAGDFRSGLGLGGVARRTLGILLLLVTVFLWTGSNFLASVRPFDSMTTPNHS